MSEIIFLSNVRLSFPSIIEPKKNKQHPDKPATYEAESLMLPNHAGFAQFMQRYAAMAQEKWKAHAQQVMQMIANDRKLRCFGQGHEKVNQQTLKMYDGYEGMVFISASKKSDKGAPQMIKPDGTAVDPMNTMEYQAFARKLYGGCYVNMAVKPWLQENNHGRGIRCDLIAIQFAGDGTPFGEAAADASGMFGAVAASPAAQPAMPGFFGQPAAAPAMPAPPVFGMPAQPGAMPGFFGQPAAAPAMPAPPVFGMPQMPSFMGR